MGNSPISSKKQRAAAGHLEQADAVFVGAGEAAFAMAEQFALDQVLGQRAAIDGHKGHVGPGALIVDGAGDQLLAGAGFAEDQHGRIGRGDFGDQLADLGHGGSLPDELRFAFDLFQAAFDGQKLVRQFALGGHAAEQVLQIDQLAGFGQIVECALAQGGHGRVERRFAGEHDRLGLRRKLLGLGDDFDARQAGHVEIDQDAVVGIFFQGGDGGQTVGADSRLVAHARQFQAHQFLERFFVIGEQQFQSIMRLGSDGSAPSVAQRRAARRGSVPRGWVRRCGHRCGLRGRR